MVSKKIKSNLKDVGIGAALVTGGGVAIAGLSLLEGGPAMAISNLGYGLSAAEAIAVTTGTMYAASKVFQKAYSIYERNENKKKDRGSKKLKEVL